MQKQCVLLSEMLAGGDPATRLDTLGRSWGKASFAYCIQTVYHYDWVGKVLGMSSHVCFAGDIQDLVPLKWSRAPCPGGRFPPSFIK